MKKMTLFALSVFLSLPLVGMAQDSFDDRLTALEKKQQEKAKRPAILSYADGCKAALKENKPLVTFLGGYLPILDQAKVEGAILCKALTLDGYSEGGVIISKVHSNGELCYVTTLKPTVSAKEIAAAFDLPIPMFLPTANTSAGGSVPAAPFAGPDGDSSASVDALDEVNAVRARAGLRPFLRCDGLTQAAKSAVTWRAARHWGGHCPGSDFAHLPAGYNAGAAGCGLASHQTWSTCCTFENWTYAGAAYAYGSNGIRYMHLFVR